MITVTDVLQQLGIHLSAKEKMSILMGYSKIRSFPTYDLRTNAGRILFSKHYLRQLNKLQLQLSDSNMAILNQARKCLELGASGDFPEDIVQTIEGYDNVEEHVADIYHMLMERI